MRLLRHSVIRFVLVGISNTAVGLGVIYFALRVLEWNDTASNAVGYAVGFAWSFLWNRSWTFRQSGAALGSLVRYVGVCVVGYLVNLAVMIVLLRRMGAGHYLPQVVAMCAYTAVTYIGSRFFAFPRSADRLRRA